METKPIKIEFFHDVLCAWCYALSPRVDKLKEKYGDRIEIVHRSFALAPEPSSIAQMFGNKEAGRKEILNHWRAANQNDDEHRIHAEIMVKKTFDYPYSTPGLLACKAAELQGGNAMHEKIFNRIQKAHLTDCDNINDFEVLKKCAADVGLDVEKWENDYHSQEVRQKLDEDLYKAYQYGVNSVPTLIANEKYKLSGAQRYETLEQWLSQVK
ncbi:MAG TPA: DsbA family protein [Bacteroidales bacterium]|nr:DsbA family protein [Bacteroidales bacterium]